MTTTNATKTLHGTWAGSDYGGNFYFWVELIRPPLGLRKTYSTRSGEPYPSALAADKLSRSLENWFDLGGRYFYALDDPIYAALPDPKTGAIKGWQVPIATLAAEDLLATLLVLGDHVHDDFATSPEIGYWATAASFALELVIGGHYLPELIKAKHWRSSWAVDVDDPAVAPRFNQLAEAMPPGCRTFALNSEALANVLDGQLADPHAALKGFLGKLVEAQVRSVLSSKPFNRPRTTDQAVNEWVSSLFQEYPLLDVGRGKKERQVLESLYDSYKRWQGDDAAKPGGYRVALRLEPPLTPDQIEEQEAIGEPVDPATVGKWRLHFLLQASDDPSLLVPAGEVWRSGGQLDYLGHRFERPQERLLAALGQVVASFAPAERALREPQPTGLYLTTGEAYQFLNEAAAPLEAAGLALLIPNWWQQRPKWKARAKLKGKEAQKKGSGLFSAEQLVEYDWQMSVGGDPLTAEEFAQIAALKEPLVQIKGQWVELRPEQRDAALAFLKRGGHGEMALGDAVRLALGGEGEKAAGLEIEQVETAGWLRTLMGELAEDKLTDLAPPATLNATLRPYQVRGYSWLAFLRRYGLGACLADDMGLGKTIQLLTLLLREKEAGATSPSLLICPTSVVGNWQREAGRFTPDLKVMIHHGAARQRESESFASEANRNDIVISSYGLAARDSELFGGVQWRSVVLDEAQNIKNPATRQTQAIKAIPAAHRVALTGTPVENRLSELWSIMDFLNPGYLGNQENFRKVFARPIEQENDPAALEKLRKLAAPFILRRLKTDPRIIQDLPQKNEMKVYCNLTVEQASLYQAFVNDIMQQIEQAEGIGRRGLILKLLLRLKQLCNHPAQFLGDESAIPGRSGKLARLEEMLEEALAEGDKALIFSQFAEMGSTLHTYLQEKLGVEAIYLHGGTPRVQREKMVQRFQTAEGPPIFILSLKAGGVGLNLTAANHVFHYDRWWNPAVENQATDRAFRIGQTKSVQVHKFICIGTLEERIDQLIESKRALAESVIGGEAEGWLTELSTADLRDLVRLSADAVGE